MFYQNMVNMVSIRGKWMSFLIILNVKSRISSNPGKIINKKILSADKII